MDIKFYEYGKQIKSIKFHKNGNKKKEKYYDGTFLEYNENGNMIHCNHTNGEEAWVEYNENNECIYFKINNIILIDKRKNKGE